MLDPQRVLATVQRPAALFRATPGRAGSIVRLTPEQVDDVVVVGDLHGHVDVLAQILKRSELESHPRRHIVVQELVHDTRIDPDEGHVDRSHRLVDLVCALKFKYPTRVHYLMGNHELSELTGRSISKKGHALDRLFKAGVGTDYPDHVDVLHDAYIALFRSLPLMVHLPNRVLACHTIPDARDLDTFDSALLDGTNWPDDSLKRGGTVYSCVWGRDTSPETADRFAQITDADLFLCGHHPCDEGFRQPNHRMLIVDGTEPKPGYILLPANEPMTMERLADLVRILPVADR